MTSKTSTRSKPKRAKEGSADSRKAKLDAGERLATPMALRSKPSKQLDVFDNPAVQRDYTLRFDIPEFTCLCPLTGQPDFAHFVIDMVPDHKCIELKSLKMYTWSFRDQGAFHEKVTNTILDDLVRAADPRFVRVSAHWFVRGGIVTDVVVEHRKKGWKPAVPVVLPAPQ
jgi:7-cyano-7-deazaguanine reductase